MIWFGKFLAESSCELEITLAWAVSARNALSNYLGFSPNQLVFGFNPAVPDIYINDPPALEDFSCSTLVRNNLTALHSARQDFPR